MDNRLGASLMMLTILVAGCSAGGTSDAPPPAASATPLDSPALPTAFASGEAAIDQAFIDMMVPHHRSAVEMAKLAPERAEHEELRTLAGDIITAQEREISEMKAWRAEWFGSDQTPPMDAMPVLPGVEMPGMGDDMDGATMDMTAAIEMLRTADPFDEAFIEAMIGHHESAIAAAEVVLPQTERPEIRSLAEDIIESQQAEIDQMETWRAEWYPDAP